MEDDESFEKLRKHERTGRPLGDEAFLRRLSQALNRDLMPKRPGPKPASKQKARR